MTKFLAIAALTLSGFAVSAQQKTSFGIRGGVNFQNINGDDASGSSLDNKLKVGFLAGVNAEIPVGIDFYLQPGVLVYPDRVPLPLGTVAITVAEQAGPAVISIWYVASPDKPVITFEARGLPFTR